jgi:hypothetical protein
MREDDGETIEPAGVLHDWLVSMEAEQQLAEAQLAELRLTLAQEKSQRAAAELLAEVRVAALRELIEQLKEQLAWLRRPWWQRLLG